MRYFAARTLSACILTDDPSHQPDEDRARVCGQASNPTVTLNTVSMDFAYKSYR
jgi:hypothetical protein